MPQDEPPVIGKEAIGSIYKSVLNEFDFSSESKLVEAQVSGDWGYFLVRVYVDCDAKNRRPADKEFGKIDLYRKAPARRRVEDCAAHGQQRWRS